MRPARAGYWWQMAELTGFTRVFEVHPLLGE
jgi:hypothetical protein